MRNIYLHTSTNTYGILDEKTMRIYWVNDDLSPIWSNWVHGQKSIDLNSVKSQIEFICELEFDYVHVTDLSLNASLD